MTTHSQNVGGLYLNSYPEHSVFGAIHSSHDEETILLSRMIQTHSIILKRKHLKSQVSLGGQLQYIHTGVFI